MADKWLSLADIAIFLGLSERSVLELEQQGLPLRRVTPKASPGILESQLLAWIKRRPRKGGTVRKHNPA